MVSRYGLPVVVRHRVRPRDRGRDAGPALPVLRCAPVSRGDPRLAGRRRSLERPDRGQLLRGATADAARRSRRSRSCPPDTAVALIALAVIGGAIATIRLLHLRWWWLLFPPLVQCVLSGNVQSLIVPLILVPAGGLAVILKIYAGLPLAILGRWRALAAAAAIMLATVPVLPWATYINEFALISQRLADQSKLTLPMGFLAARVAARPAEPPRRRARSARPGSSSRRSGRPSSSTTGRSPCRSGARSRWP